MRIKDYMALISKYRTPIMGFCIINVLFGHTNMILWGPFNYIVNSVWMIDIFFFFSGLGAFHSLTKNNNVLEFYKRRVKRIYPTYLPCAVAYILLMAPAALEKVGVFGYIQQFLGNVLMLGWAAGLDNQFNWYPQSIMIVYLLTPGLFFLIKSFDGSRKKLSALFGFFLVGQLCFLGGEFVVATSRMLSFLMGIIAAELASRDEDIKLNIPLMLILAVIGHVLIYYALRMDADTIWHYGTTWYPALIAIPGTMWVLCKVFEFAEKKKWLAWFMFINNKAGRYSFEIFMLHMVIYDAMPVFGWHLYDRGIWCIVAIASGVLSVFYGMGIDKLRKKIGWA